MAVEDARKGFLLIGKARSGHCDAPSNMSKAKYNVHDHEHIHGRTLDCCIMDTAVGSGKNVGTKRKESFG